MRAAFNTYDFDGCFCCANAGNGPKAHNAANTITLRIIAISSDDRSEKPSAQNSLSAGNVKVIWIFRRSTSHSHRDPLLELRKVHSAPINQQNVRPDDIAILKPAS